MNPSPQDHARPDRRWHTSTTLGVWLIRAVVIATAFISVVLAVRNGVVGQRAGGMLFAWDSLHYLRILTTGYPQQIEPIIAFFPGYPLLAWPVAKLVNPALALLVVSNVCSLLGLFLMYRWTARMAGAPAACVATLLAASFPPAMFLAAAYVQGPMFLAVVITLMFMQRSKWMGAGLASAFATALHPTGVAVAVTLGLGMLMKRVRWTTMVAVMIVSMSGVLAYQGFLWARFGQFDAYLRAQANWSVTAGSESGIDGDAGVIAEPSATPWETSLPAPFDKLVSIGAWNKLWLLVILALTVIGLVRPGPIPRELFALPIVIFLLGYLPGNGARVTSIARLETVALPCFVVAATMLGRWRPVWITAVVAMTLMQMWYAFAFSRGAWAG